MRITSLDVNGEGLGTLDGRPVAVPLTIPGEDVEARAASRRGGGADLVRVLSPSPHRVAPACRHFGSCGGCSWQHIAYAEQLRLKRRILQELIEAATGPGAPEVLPTLPTPAHDPLTAKLDAPPSDPPAPWHFRNKAAFVFGPGSQGRPLVMGHFRRRLQSVVPIDECPVHREEGNQAAFLMRDALGRARIPGASSDGTEGVARHAVVRVAEDTGDWLTTLVVTENVKPLRRASDHFVRAAIRGATPSGALPQARGLCLNTNDRPGPLMFGRDTRHVAGARAIWERVAGVSFLLSPTSFFQTNVRAARALAAEVLSALSGDEYERILDLYSGVGLFALPLAREGRSVTAVEGNREAVAAACEAARANRITARSFRALAAPVERAMSRLDLRGPAGGWDAVVLDPPREGCAPDVLDWLLRTLRPKRIVYVSCNPEALAHDLRLAAPADYRVARVRPVDMFPHTAHVESVSVLDCR